MCNYGHESKLSKKEEIDYLYRIIMYKNNDCITTYKNGCS